MRAEELDTGGMGLGYYPRTFFDNKTAVGAFCSAVGNLADRIIRCSRNCDLRKTTNKKVKIIN